MKKNQKGFSLIEGLLILVIVGLLGGVGWYVWQSSEKTKQSLENVSTVDLKTPVSSTKEDSTKVNKKEYKDDKRTFKFTYPFDWTLKVEDAPADSYDGQQKRRTVIIKSPDYASTQSVIEEVNKGSVITVNAANTELTEPVKSSLESSEGFKETRVAGVKAYYYIAARGRVFSYSFVNNGVIYTLGLRTVEGDKSSEQKYQPVFQEVVDSFKL